MLNPPVLGTAEQRGAPIAVDLLIVHATAITMDPDRRVIEDCGIAISNGRLVFVGTAEVALAGYQPTELLDCRGHLVLPGLIDAHGHGGHALLKTIGVDTLSWWMRIVTRTYFEHTSAEYWYADGLLSALERLKFGVTCGVSVLGSQPRSDEPEFGAGHGRAYSELGLREVIGAGPAGLPWPREVGHWRAGKHVRREVGLAEMLAGTEELIRQWHGAAGGLIQVSVTPYTMVPSLNPGGPSTPDLATALTAEDREQSARVRELAARYGTRIHTDAFGGMVELAHRQDEHALLGPDVHFQHGFGLSNSEIAILAETGTSVTHGPGVLVGALRGRCPVVELLDAGVTVAISTDGCAPMSSFDLFTAMRQAQTLSQLQLRDIFVLPPGKLLEMVTIDAAGALGLADEIGSLELGKAADLITLDARQAHLQPLHMPVQALVYKASGQDVDTVIVAGKVLMRGRLVSTVDESEVLARARQEADLLIERSGLDRFITEPVWRTSRQLFPSAVPFDEQ